MKPYYIALLLVTFGILFWVSRTTQDQRVQAQEAPPEIEVIDQKTFRIVMKIESENDLPVADILWFQKAAEVAIKHNIPWFNVIEEKMTKTHLEGIIQLEPDPMKGEYDANEILSLHLMEEVAD